MTSILFVTSTRIGDCILSTGLYRWLAENEPDARITVACGPLGAPVFRAAPALERTIVVAKSPTGHRGHWLKLWREVFPTRWDLVVDLRGSGLAYVLRARKRRVFRGEAREPEHKVVELGRVLGLSPPPDPVFWLDDKARSDAAALLGDDPRPLLAIAPAAAVPVKAWDPLRFAEVAEQLLAGPMAGARVLVLGGPGDAAAAAPLLERLGPEQAVDAVGQLDMPAAAAAVARARLYIGADSGLGHAAAAVGAPTLSLFGPTDERRYAPWGEGVKVARGGPQMADLDVATVYREAVALLDSSAA
jgi:lipopolysaccharide export system permease protein